MSALSNTLKNSVSIIFFAFTPWLIQWWSKYGSLGFSLVTFVEILDLDFHASQVVSNIWIWIFTLRKW
jgi:hypothetical protein